MTDYEKMKHLYNELGIGFTAELDRCDNDYKVIFIHNTNVTFMFDCITEKYITMNISY